MALIDPETSPSFNFTLLYDMYNMSYIRKS